MFFKMHLVLIFKHALGIIKKIGRKRLMGKKDDLGNTFNNKIEKIKKDW